MSTPSPLTILRVFLKLGATSFGGPIAHLALMDQELVQKRAWLSRHDFLELHAITQLIPGPNSTELAMAIGHQLAGRAGLLAAGVGFIVPAFLSSGVLAILYLQAGRLPIGQEILYTIRPLILVIILRALYAFARQLPRQPLLWIGGSALAAHLLGVHELLILLLGGLSLIFRNRTTRMKAPAFLAMLTPKSMDIGTLPEIFQIFFKIGAVLFGSGYTLLLYLREDLVDRLGWLTESQLLDAITVGQITPGPLFSTATFIGFLLQGWPGAGLATLGIFGPAFLMIAFGAYLLPRLRRHPEVPRFLQGVNSASMGLMLYVSFSMIRVSLIDTLSIGLAVGAFFLLEKARMDAGLLIFLGVVMGCLKYFL